MKVLKLEETELNTLLCALKRYDETYHEDAKLIDKLENVLFNRFQSHERYEVYAESFWGSDVIACESVGEAMEEAKRFSKEAKDDVLVVSVIETRIAKFGDGKVVG